MTNKENIPLPPSKGELSDIVPPNSPPKEGQGWWAGGCFFLHVILNEVKNRNATKGKPTADVQNIPVIFNHVSKLAVKKVKA